MAGQSVYKVGIVVSADASAVKPGATEARNEITSIGTAASATKTKMQQLIATATGLHAGAANSNRRAWTGTLAAEGMALDNLRAKYNPLFAVIQQYKAAQVEIRTAHAMGALSTEEMTAAMQRQRQAALASIDAIKGRNAVIAQGNSVAASGGHNFAATNAMFQLQDIGVTAAMGMSPAMIALQQGSQLAGNFAGMSLKQVGTTMAGAFTALLSPVSLATVAVTGLTAAAIQYFMKSDQETEKANKSLEEHDSLIRRLRDAYGEAATGAREYTGESKKILGQDTADSIKNYRKLIDESAKTMLAGGDFSIWDRLTGSGPLTIGDYDGKTYIIGQMQSAIAQLKDSAVAGTPDIQSFVEKLIEIENHPAVPKKVQEMAQELRKLAAEGLAAQKALTDLLNRPGLQRGIIIGGETELSRLDYLDSQRLSLDRMREEATAQRAALSARSPAEKAAAARQQAGLDRSGSADEYNLRVELAGQQALAQAEKELTEAKRDRIRSITETVESQQLELSLIGKTLSEVEALRMQYQLTSQLKAEAAKSGVGIDQEELRLIEEKARAYGQLAEQIAATNLLRGQQSSMEQLRVEAALVGQSDEVRRRSLALLEAEQQIRERGIASDSTAARQYRQNAIAIADQTAEVERLRDAWGEVQSAIEGVVNNGVDKLIDGDWQGALDAVKDTLVSGLTQIGIKNPLANALDGGNRGTISDLGGIGGIIGRLFAGDGDPAKIVPGAMQSVGSMSVTAATVMINGGVAGGVGSAAANALTGANQNSLAGSTDIASYIAKAAAARGIDPSIALKVARSEGGLSSWNLQSSYVKNGVREDSWGPFQLFMKGGLGNRFQAQTGLDPRLAQNGPAGVDFALDYAKKNGWGSWYGAAKAGIGNFDGIGVSTNITAASDAAKSFAVQTSAATQGLGVLGTGFDKFGSALSNVGAGGASSGGGLFGWLSSLFSPSAASLNASIGFTGANTTLGAFLTGKAEGGYSGPGGKYEPRGIYHAGEVIFSQADVARLGGVGNVEAIRTGRRALGNRWSGGPADVVTLPAAAFPSQPASGSNVSINVQNYSGQEIHQEETTDSRGNRQVTMVIGQQAAAAIKQRGNPARQAIQNDFAVKTRGINR